MRLQSVMVMVVLGCGGGGATDELSASDCSDGLDNDADGLTDCEDIACAAFDFCEAPRDGGASDAYAESTQDAQPTPDATVPQPDAQAQADASAPADASHDAMAMTDAIVAPDSASDAAPEPDGSFFDGSMDSATDAAVDAPVDAGPPPCPDDVVDETFEGLELGARPTEWEQACFEGAAYDWGATDTAHAGSRGLTIDFRGGGGEAAVGLPLEWPRSGSATVSFRMRPGAYANVPGDEAAKLLTTLTRHAVSPSRIKRFVVDESTAMLEQELDLFDAILARREVPPRARTLVISVDALSLRLREEGWKQATVATLTMLDAEGEPVRRGSGTHTIRLAEMPEAGKATIMSRVEREVRALVAQRPDLALEIVIDGATDLRTHLLERFPEARHLTDFFHVVEHLAAALRLLFPSDDARRAAERARWCHKLKHKQGTGFRLWRWLRDEMAREDDPVQPWARREIEKHAEYIYNQREWMKYPAPLGLKALDPRVAIRVDRAAP